MGQLIIHGAKRAAFLESITPADVLALKENQSRLSVLTNEKAGIMDDLMITSKANHVYMVVNAACKESDLKHMRAKLVDFNAKHGADVRIEYIEDRSLVALQGPKSAEVLSRLLPAGTDLNSLLFMYTRELKVAGIDCWVSRCGYTGEDGFEISVPSDKAVALWEAILEHKEVAPAGLAVRDSLRLEAGLCLYGHDMNDTITPVEAGLTWTITKRRRQEGGYPGHEIIAKQLADGVEKRRVGLIVKKGAPAREGALIKTADGTQIGTVTSGSPSPSLQKLIAMGYVKDAYSAVGTQLMVEVRGKLNEAEVVKMPFLPAKYFKPKA